MKIPFILGNKEYELKAYNTSKEKEILLMHSFGVYDLRKILEALEFEKFDDLSEDEMKVILYRYREISIGDEIDIRFKCDECGQVNDSKICTDNLVKKSERNDPEIKKILKPFKEDHMQDYVDIDVDELDIVEYEELKRKIIANQDVISFIKTANCMKCGAKKSFDIGNPKYIVEIMSEDSLMSLYKAYNFLNFFGDYTKTDIDNMYPFERNIFIGLLKKTKEDMNK